MMQLESLESLESLERLESLKSLESLESLEPYTGAYDAVPISENEDCVIYCDIPYRGTDGYGNTSKTKETIDYEAFYDWVRRSPHLVFVSEYQMPPDFVAVAEFAHRSTVSATANNAVVERVFVHRSKLTRLPPRDLFGF